MESFELDEWARILDGDLDACDVESVLGAAIPVIVEALAPQHEPI